MTQTDDKLKETVRAELERIGLDPNNVDEAQADMAYVRRTRKRDERFAGWIKIGIVSTGLTVLVSVLMYVVKGEW